MVLESAQRGEKGLVGNMTLGQMIKKYQGLQKQQYEQVLISDVLADLLAIKRRAALLRAGVKKEDL